MNVMIIKGINQIGGCITEIKCKNTRIIIDFGDELENTNETFELEGLTYGTPKYNAVFITHSHGDHIGLIDKILESIPVFVEEKSLEIHNLTCDFCGKERINRNINVFKLPKNIEDTKPIYENKDLKVTPYIVDHSSYNSCMYLVEGDKEKILHTGDFRNHGRKEYLFDETLKNIGKVDLLITEGTTLTRSKEKYMDELELETKAKEIMNNYNQVFIMQSSTNIDRTVSFLKASVKSNKKFVLDLFSYYLNKSVDFKIKVDYKKIFVWKPYKYKSKPDWFKYKYLDIETSSNIFPNFTMEVKESMLPDIKMLYKKGVLKNACLVYSMWDGYIKKEEKLQKFIEELNDMNIEFIALHTSGHADLNAMKKLNEYVSPNKTIIIHTENAKEGIDIFNNVQEISKNIYYQVGRDVK